MLKIRRSGDRLIFGMGIPVHVQTVYIKRRGPGWLVGELTANQKQGLKIRVQQYVF